MNKIQIEKVTWVKEVQNLKNMFYLWIAWIWCQQNNLLNRKDKNKEDQEGWIIFKEIKIIIEFFYVWNCE
jgi:hypothetical protein